MEDKKGCDNRLTHSLTNLTIDKRVHTFTDPSTLKNGTMENILFERLEERRRILGLTYMNLAEMTGLSHTVIHQVLTERPSNVPINRARIAGKVDHVMAEIKKEEPSTEVHQPL